LLVVLVAWVLTPELPLLQEEVVRLTPVVMPLPMVVVAVLVVLVALVGLAFLIQQQE